MIEMFVLMLMGHALADQGLQSEWVAKNKNPENNKDWWIVMASHGLIHGFMVYAVTRSWVLGIAESIAHSTIDIGKCQGAYGLKFDQTLHVLCKALWIAAIACGFVPGYPAQ